MVLLISQLFMVIVLILRLASPPAASRSLLVGLPVTGFLLVASGLWLVMPIDHRIGWFGFVPSIVGFLIVLCVLCGHQRLSVSAFWDIRVELVIAIALALLFACRPTIFEYPSDNTTYFTWFANSLVDGHSRISEAACGLQNLLTYSYDCKLWLFIAGIGPRMPLESLFLGGLSLFRLSVFFEVLLLSLAVLSLFRHGNVRGWRAGYGMALILFGLGNKGVSFAVNHAVQGSLLAAVVLLEVFGLILWLVAALQGIAVDQKKGLCVKAYLVVGPVFALQLFLLLRLHGLFALLALVVVLPMTLLLGLDGMRRNGLLGLRRLDGYIIFGTGLVATALLIWPVGAWTVKVSDTWFVQRWQWLMPLGIPFDQLPVSFLTRSPNNRPELLSVIGLVLSIYTLWTLSKNSSRPIVSLALGADDRHRYGVVSAFYAISIAIVFLLPPFSNIFLHVSRDMHSHYRLMWGAVLFSPLPLWIGLPRVAGAALTCVLGALVFVPLPLFTLASPQLFFSKSRHIFVPAPVAADQERLLHELIPVVHEISSLGRPSQSLLADPQISEVLVGVGSGRITLLSPAFRLTRRDQQPKVNGLQSNIPSEILRSLSGISLVHRPDWIVQRRPTACSYSIYVDVEDIDPCVVQSIQKRFINGVGSDQLESLGYERWGHASQLTLWRKRQD